MGRYFKITEIPFKEYEKVIGEDLGIYSVLGKAVGNNYYVGVDDEIEDEFVVELIDVPELKPLKEGEKRNLDECSKICENFDSECHCCSDTHTSNWVHDNYSIPDHKCQSCRFKYNFLENEPCKSCEMIMESKFVLKSE